MTRIALLQMRAGIDPCANLDCLTDAIAEAADGGGAMLFTPEMSGLLDRERSRAAENIRTEEDDPVLAGVRDAARDRGIWVALGSLALDKGDGRWTNRAFVIDDKGEIVGRYDKLHLFDVDLGNGDDWRESSAYDAGDWICVVETPVGRLGLTICYDLRFPALFDALGRARCDAIAIPAAFTAPTGDAHWHVLQRARAVEASSFVIAAAQCGEHEDGRRTYGHSLAVDPWGKVLLDMGADKLGVDFVELDSERIAEARRRLPSLANRRQIPESSPQ